MLRAEAHKGLLQTTQWMNTLDKIAKQHLHNLNQTPHICYDKIIFHLDRIIPFNWVRHGSFTSYIQIRLIPMQEMLEEPCQNRYSCPCSSVRYLLDKHVDIIRRKISTAEWGGGLCMSCVKKAPELCALHINQSEPNARFGEDHKKLNKYITPTP